MVHNRCEVSLVAEVSTNGGMLASGRARCRGCAFWCDVGLAHLIPPPSPISSLTNLPATVPESLLVENVYHWSTRPSIPVLASQRLIYSRLDSMLYRVVPRKAATHPTISADRQRQSQYVKTPANVGKTQPLPVESVGH